MHFISSVNNFGNVEYDFIFGPTPSAELNPLARIDQLTQQEMVDALVAGASLTFPDGSSWSALDDTLRRVLFKVWPDGIRAIDSRASSDEAEAILEAANSTDDLPTWTHAALSTNAPVWSLISVKISHFGGVNGAVSNDVVRIELPQKGLLIYGRNGSGKTSLSRALMWSLTGNVIDTDGVDKPAPEVTSIYETDDGSRSLTLPSIIPFPTRAQLDDPSSISLPQINLEFKAPDGHTRLVERRLVRARVFTQTCRWATISGDGETSDWSETDDVSTMLEIPRQALENAALQVARLEKLNPRAERNPLAAGLERLSGLTRLGEVSDRLSDKLSAYLSGGYANGLQRDADSERTKVLDSLTRMKAALDRGGIEPPPDGDTSSPATCEQHLHGIEAFLAPKRVAADQALSDVLGLAEGESPPANMQNDLTRARDSVNRLTEDDPVETVLSIWANEQKIAEIQAKAREVEARLERSAALQQDRARKVRSALYARIEKWAEDEDEPEVDWQNCPVCDTDLTDLSDPMLSEPIIQAAMQARRDTELLREDAARLDAQWSEEISAIFEDCPGVDNLDLFKMPPELLGLYAFREQTDLLGMVVQKVVSALPEADHQGTDAAFEDFPLTRKSLAIAEKLATCLVDVSRAVDNIRSKRTTIVSNINLLLDQVDEALRTHEPIRTALSELASARTALTSWKPIYNKVDLAKSLGPQLSDFRRVREAIDAVVAHTLGTLKAQAIGTYYAKLYRRPWFGQPQVQDVKAAQDSKLDILAGIDDITADGSRLLNHSHLRSVLLAFAGALKESADQRSGGIDVILQDDPQTLVDDINRDGLGSWLKMLRTAGSRPILLTHSDAFASVAEAKLKTPRMRVRPSSGMREQGQLLLVGGANEIKQLADQLSTSTDEAIYTRLCAAIRIEIEDRLRAYCDTFGIEMAVSRPTLYDCRMALITARSQPAYRDRLSTGPFDDLLRDRYINRSDDIAGQVMDALNEAHHAPKNNVTQVDAWQASAGWEHLSPILFACDAIAFDALNAPRVLPPRPDETEFIIPPVSVTTAVAAFQRSLPEQGENWDLLDLRECYALRVRRNFDWLPEYVKGGDVLLISRGEPADTTHRLIFARHFQPGPNSSVSTSLGFGGKSHGRLMLWGVGSKAIALEPPYEIDTVRGILYSTPEVTGENGFLSLQQDDIDLSEFKAAPILGESAEPYARSGDHILIRENDRIEAGQPLVNQQLYLIETSEGAVFIKRFDRRASGPNEVLLFQPASLSLGGSGTALLSNWAPVGDDAEASDDTPVTNVIAGVWPVRGILFAA